MSRPRVAAMIAAGLWVLLAGCAPSPSASRTDAASPSIVGAWRSSVQFKTGAFASIRDLEFSYVFNQGGTMTESSNYDGAPPVPPAYGVWRPLGPGRFEAKYVFYVTKAPADLKQLTSGGGWMPAGRGELLEEIALGEDGRSFTSTIRYTPYDAAGAASEGGGEATAKATRITF